LFSAPKETPVSQSPYAHALAPVAMDATLFIETEAVGTVPAEPQIIRSRFVKINLALLIDEMGQPRNVKEITLNLFPDKVYTGVIETIKQSGDGYSWVGYLKDVEHSALTMVYTSSVFIAHFNGPMGIYEVSSAGDNLYRIIMIDQTKFPGGD
jgi:hypothetical protein